MQTTDTVEFEKIGFDGERYISIQKKAIQERIAKFPGRLYLEIGGKFLRDPHASRVLPGFFIDSKKEIFASFVQGADIIFCINAQDIQNNRQLSSGTGNYLESILDMLQAIERELGKKSFVSINRVSEKNKQEVLEAKSMLKNNGFDSYLRYEIPGYPEHIKTIFGEHGYKKDEYIPVSKDLILVTGAASSSGKMSTCLGQIYQEYEKNIASGYAKYETFPIWNIALDHPVNLAYEAATADIGDYNIYDTYHEQAYGEKSVNYNRDVEAFEIVMKLASNFLPEHNFTRSYQSPTDMGINKAGFCITDEKVVQQAAIEEIRRRKHWYENIFIRGEGDMKAVQICEALLKKVT